MVLNDIAPQNIALNVVDARVDDEHGVTPGVWLAAAPYTSERFQGAEVFMSCNGGSYYEYCCTIPRASVIGYSTIVLDAPVIKSAWDLTTGVTIDIARGTLSSAGTALVLAECANIAKLGDEILSFTTATAFDDYQYTLTGFLRYLRGTGAEVVAHAAGDEFTLLDKRTMIFVPIPGGLLNTTLYVKAATPGRDLSEIRAQTFTFEANNVRPYAPADLAAVEGTDDIVLTWVPTSMLSKNVLGYAGATDSGIDGRPEHYYIEVWDDDAVALVRTATVADARTWTWTSAMQTADGYVPAGATTVNITFKVSHVGPWNKSRFATIAGAYGLASGAE